MPSELKELKNTLEGYHIPVSMEWLESCAEWCKSDLPPNYTIKELYRSVYEQWLFLGKLNTFVLNDLKVPVKKPQV